ncbi:MAG: aminotransferase class V-fold PLP-dependent enzyme [Acidobacteriota bacterium]
MSQAKVRRAFTGGPAINSMSARVPLEFKIAQEDGEFELVHRLNYKTFVEEIPQHQACATQRLVDKFHAENTYFLCMSGGRLAGMLAVRDTRPFSLDHKLANLDALLPAARAIFEIRLLAVDQDFRGARGGRVLAGLFTLLRKHSAERDYDLALISGTTRQLRLYRHLGFVPFGPLVGSPEAQYQPMYLRLQAFEAMQPRFLARKVTNFLPGPVTVSADVRRAFEQLPESHRSEQFRQEFAATRSALCDLVRAKHVQLFMGSGTLANDVVGAQLSLRADRGVVVRDGEFGSRLVDHARRFRLDFEAVDLAEVRKQFEGSEPPAWLWVVHCETSTGTMCDLDALKKLCAEHGTELCVDCVSSIGTMAVDLSGVAFAACSSAKGLRAYSGVAMVFHEKAIAPAADRLPRYVDLGYYAQEGGIPFTFSSNLLRALKAAVTDVNWPERFAGIAEISAQLRTRLTELDFELIGDSDKVSPAVITIALPSSVDSGEAGLALQEAGYLLSYNSEYLRRLNWIQVCLMGAWTTAGVWAMVDELYRVRLREARARTVATGR